MLSRFISNPSRHLRRRLFSPQTQNLAITHLFFRHFSSNNNNNNGEKPTSADIWKIEIGGSENDPFFPNNNNADLAQPKSDDSREAVDDWLMPEFKPWSLKLDDDDEDKVDNVFGDVGAVELDLEKEKDKKSEDDLHLQKEQQTLLALLKGPNRTFGDLVAASGITDAMLDTLIALKHFQNVDGLPPLTEIHDKRYANSFKKSSRYEMELQKQEEAAKARVRQLDDKGRAYGTGRRKCSIARVWIQPGGPNFMVNDKEFDAYFPMLDHRAALLRPFSETQTLGLWDIKCTVKGGGVSGQVGAIQLGISRALQCWEPGLRPPLREAGFLTRDSRVVERKKPGKAKARKSFQWVKR